MAAVVNGSYGSQLVAATVLQFMTHDSRLTADTALNARLTTHAGHTL